MCLVAANLGVFRMSLGFYRAFEEKYRDSRQVIKLRLEVYLPFIEQLIGFYDHPKQ